MGVIVFISYAMKDSKRLNIPEIAELLKLMKNIDRVYWEKWDGHLNTNIIKFIEKEISECDVFIPIFTIDYFYSSICEKEYKIALIQNKRIIPLFEFYGIVPTSCRLNLGINLTKKSIDNIATEIHRLIFSQSTFLTFFHGIQLVKTDVEILQEIEKLTKKEFKNVDDLYNSLEMSFSVNENAVKGINLNRCKLTTLPESIGNFYSLKILCLNNNQLKSLPESIGNLKNLKSLDLYGNVLINLPESIGKLMSLEELLLMGNDLSYLPDSFCNLQALEFLDLCGNKIKTFPESIIALESLETLDLCGNGLINLPENIGKMKSLGRLLLVGNELSTLPESISNLQSLYTLNIEFNNFKDFPELITTLKSLENLLIGSNSITTLPESIANLKLLTVLDLDGIEGNKISILPESIGNLEFLEKLDLYRNPFLSLPESLNKITSLKTLKVNEKILDLNSKNLVKRLKMKGVNIISEDIIDQIVAEKKSI